jgi:Putative RNA methyltransferase
VEAGVRVTLKLGPTPREHSAEGKTVYAAELVHPGEPREQAGLYWGYLTRIAATLEAMFEEGPFKGEGFESLGMDGTWVWCVLIDTLSGVRV